MTLFDIKETLLNSQEHSEFILPNNEIIYCFNLTKTGFEALKNVDEFILFENIYILETAVGLITPWTLFNNAKATTIQSKNYAVTNVFLIPETIANFVSNNILNTNLGLFSVAFYNDGVILRYYAD